MFTLALPLLNDLNLAAEEVTRILLTNTNSTELRGIVIIPFTTAYYFSVLTLSIFKHELTELHLFPTLHHIFGHTAQQSYDVRMRFKLLQQVQFRQKVLEIGLGRFFYNRNIIFICVKCLRAFMAHDCSLLSTAR